MSQRAGTFERRRLRVQEGSRVDRFGGARGPVESLAIRANLITKRCVYKMADSEWRRSAVSKTTEARATEVRRRRPRDGPIDKAVLEAIETMILQGETGRFHSRAVRPGRG